MVILAKFSSLPTYQRHKYRRKKTSTQLRHVPIRTYPRTHQKIRHRFHLKRRIRHVRHGVADHPPTPRFQSVAETQEDTDISSPKDNEFKTVSFEGKFQ